MESLFFKKKARRDNKVDSMEEWFQYNLISDDCQGLGVRPLINEQRLKIPRRDDEGTPKGSQGQKICISCD